jgi:hypothetical protein
MHDEDLMKALGRAARAEPSPDARYDALAAGTLSDAERDALLEEAARSEAAAEAYDAFRPLGAEFQARVVHRILAGRGAAPGGDREAAAPGPAAAPAEARKVVPFPVRTARRFIPLALAASVLVAVGLVMLRGEGGGPLPGYGLTLEGQVMLMRGEAPPAEAAPFAPGNRFRLVLTPERDVAGEVEARAWVQTPDGRVEPLAAPAARIAETGAVLIEGDVGGDVQLPQGESTLFVVVGRAGALPDAGEATAAVGAEGRAQADAWTAWAIPLRVE